MKIAQVAPLWEGVPPSSFGKTELVFSLLTDEVISQDNEDSQPQAKLKAVYSRALRFDMKIKNYAVYSMLPLSQIGRKAVEFKIISPYVKIRALPSANLMLSSTVHTLSSKSTRDKRNIDNQHQNHPHTSIRNAQRQFNLSCSITCDTDMVLAEHPDKEMANIVPAIWELLNRQTHQKYAENKFSVTQMAHGYEAVDEEIIQIRRVDLNYRLHAGKILTLSRRWAGKRRSLQKIISDRINLTRCIS